MEQTAEFRYSIRWRGARELFAARGYDLLSVIQLTCEHGDDGHFALEDGTGVSCDLRRDPETRQVIAFDRWEPFQGVWDDEDDEDGSGLAWQIFQDSRLKSAFDMAVYAFFEFHWKERDAPLPPKAC